MKGTLTIETFSGPLTIRDPTPEEVEAARAWVGIWFQVSRKHRIVARFPDGVSPRDALRSVMGKHCGGKPRGVLPHEERWISRFSETSCGDHFLSSYTTYYPELQRTLSYVEFSAFRLAGGDTYSSYRYTIGKYRE